MTLLVLTHGHKHIKLMTKHPSDVSTSLHASVLPSETAGTRKWDIIWLSNETNLIWFTQTMVQKKMQHYKILQTGDVVPIPDMFPQPSILLFGFNQLLLRACLTTSFSPCFRSGAGRNESIVGRQMKGSKHHIWRKMWNTIWYSEAFCREIIQKRPQFGRRLYCLITHVIAVRCGVGKIVQPDPTKWFQQHVQKTQAQIGRVKSRSNYRTWIYLNQLYWLWIQFANVLQFSINLFAQILPPFQVKDVSDDFLQAKDDPSSGVKASAMSDVMSLPGS